MLTACAWSTTADGVCSTLTSTFPGAVRSPSGAPASYSAELCHDSSDAAAASAAAPAGADGAATRTVLTVRVSGALLCGLKAAKPLKTPPVPSLVPSLLSLSLPALLLSALPAALPVAAALSSPCSSASRATKWSMRRCARAFARRWRRSGTMTHVLMQIEPHSSSTSDTVRLPVDHCEMSAVVRPVHVTADTQLNSASMNCPTAVQATQEKNVIDCKSKQAAQTE